VPDAILDLKPRSARGRNRPLAKPGGSVDVLLRYLITSQVNANRYTSKETIVPARQISAKQPGECKELELALLFHSFVIRDGPAASLYAAQWGVLILM
jgi:hypothetical protein